MIRAAIVAWAALAVGCYDSSVGAAVPAFDDTGTPVEASTEVAAADTRPEVLEDAQEASPPDTAAADTSSPPADTASPVDTAPPPWSWVSVFPSTGDTVSSVGVEGEAYFDEAADVAAGTRSPPKAVSRVELALEVDASGVTCAAWPLGVSVGGVGQSVSVTASKALSFTFPASATVKVRMQAFKSPGCGVLVVKPSTLVAFE